MFKMSCVLVCALCGGQVGTRLCVLLVFIRNYATIHGVEHIEHILCSVIFFPKIVPFIR